MGASATGRRWMGYRAAPGPCGPAGRGIPGAANGSHSVRLGWALLPAPGGAYLAYRCPLVRGFPIIRDLHAPPPAMAPNAYFLSLHEDQARSARPPVPGGDIPTDPALLYEMADTLDGLGSYRMADALRAQAEALTGLAGRGPGCGLPRGRA